MTARARRPARPSTSGHHRSPHRIDFVAWLCLQCNWYYDAMKRYHIWTEGCQMNVADSAKLAAGLDRFGWQATDGPEGADLVVLNTCVVRERSELRAVSKLGSLKAMKRKGEGNFQIVVMGCVVGPKDDELRRRFPYVDHF